MNERIKELAKQTGYTWHASGDPQIYEFTPEKLEKFAELIVRECAEVASGPLSFTEAAYCRVGLLKHFGIQK